MKINYVTEGTLQIKMAHSPSHFARIICIVLIYTFILTLLCIQGGQSHNCQASILDQTFGERNRKKPSVFRDRSRPVKFRTNASTPLEILHDLAKEDYHLEVDVIHVQSTTSPYAVHSKTFDRFKISTSQQDPSEKSFLFDREDILLSHPGLCLLRLVTLTSLFKHRLRFGIPIRPVTT